MQSVGRCIVSDSWEQTGEKLTKYSHYKVNKRHIREN